MTRKQAKEFLPIIQAYAEGKNVQAIDTADPNDKWEDVKEPYFSTSLEYRIKPEKKLRPWKPEEVPVGAQVKPINVSHTDIAIIIGRSSLDDKSYVYLPNDFTWFKRDRYMSAYKDYVYSTDNGKTWNPCGVEE